MTTSAVRAAPALKSAGYIVPLDEATLPELVGGKAHNLYRVSELGLRVPERLCRYDARFRVSPRRERSCSEDPRAVSAKDWTAFRRVRSRAPSAVVGAAFTISLSILRFRQNFAICWLRPPRRCSIVDQSSCAVRLSARIPRKPRSPGSLIPFFTCGLWQGWRMPCWPAGLHAGPSARSHTAPLEGWKFGAWVSSCRPRLTRSPQAFCSHAPPKEQYSSSTRQDLVTRSWPARSILGASCYSETGTASRRFPPASDPSRASRTCCTPEPGSPNLPGSPLRSKKGWVEHRT